MYLGGARDREAILPPCFFYLRGFSVLCIILSAAFLIHLPSPAFALSPVSEFNPAVLGDMRDNVFVDANAFFANNVLPMHSIIFNEWNGPFKTENFNPADGYWKTGAGLVYKGWRVSGFYRGEFFIEGNKDTVEILRMLNLKKELPVGRNFDVDMNANGFTATGIEISRGLKLDGILKGLSVGCTARYLKGGKIQVGEISGNVLPTNQKSYDFNLNIDYVYDKNYLYKRRDQGSFSGEGYSFDLGLQYLLNDKIALDVLFRDIGGRIYWKNIPYTTADATSDTKSYDEDGYQQFRPTIRGYESFKNYTQKIPFKTDVELSYSWEHLKVSSTVNLIQDRALYWIDLTYKAAEGIYIKTGYNTNYKVANIGLIYKNVLLNLYSSDIRLTKADSLGLMASLRYEW